MDQKEYTIVGKRIPRIDSVPKVTGTAKYLRDLIFQGMLHGKILRSPHPHAKIVRVDASKAERMPGVRGVVTGIDTQGIRLCMFRHLANKPPLAEDRVRFIGDEIAAVAADSEKIAERALELIEVEYEELPAIFEPTDAIKPGVIRIHEKGNIAAHRSWMYGDTQKAFGESDQIFEDRFELQGANHCCLEPYGCVAHYDQSGGLTVWMPTQMLHPLRQILADIFGIPLSRMRVIKPYTGGGFGARFDVNPIEIIAVFLSKKTGRPVRIVNTRDEEFRTGRFRYPMTIDIKTGVQNDGTILAREVKVLTDAGAYNGMGVTITSGIGAKSTYLWSVPNVKFEADVVFTNKVYGGGFRGYGNPQITFAIESQMDIIAEKLGMDMMDLCLKNVNYSGQLTCMGHKVTSCGLKECIEKTAETIGWKQKRRKKGNRGLGMGSLMHTGGGVRNLYGECNLSDVFIKMNNDGTVDLLSGIAEIGQGSDTVLAQIAAEELGIQIEDVNVIIGDTSITPQCLGAWGSRVVFIAGNATKLAAEEIKLKLFQEASTIFETHMDDFIAKNRKIYVKGNSEKAISISELAVIFYNKGKILAGRGCYDDPTHYSPDPLTGYGAVPNYGFGTQAVELEVDMETGQVKLLNFVATHDVGKAINPMMVEGQIDGGVVQGLGYALSESLFWEGGVLKNCNFLDYRIFSSADVPPIKSLIVESIDLDGPYGAKGVGEAPAIPTAAAVANAVYDAIGIRIKSLPITPQKILKALKESN